jgi:predicted nucleotidyltransferase component of viral defense system
LEESFVEREYHLLVTIEELRSNGLMKLDNPLCLGGGHGVRAFLPQELQRFSIDLDFYSKEENIHRVLRRLGKIPSLKQVGYGIESGDRFKKYDSRVPTSLEKCTAALTKHYQQSFSLAGVESEFSVTVTNTLTPVRHELRKPKSYIGIEYVKEKIPILAPALIIASKIRAVRTRKLKDLYKDIFDIYALFKLSDASFDDKQIISALSDPTMQLKKAEIYGKFKESSDKDNARSAIKLPKESRQKYLKDWKYINSFVKNKTLALLDRAGALRN